MLKKTSAAPTKMPQELVHLANEVGEFMQYWGFKRVHGRIWTHLYLSPVPLDAGTLIHRLKISKALVSLTLRDLINYEVILESGKSTQGTQLYSANPEVTTVILNVLRIREKKMLAQTATAAELVEQLPDHLAEALVNKNRLKKLKSMIEQAQLTLDHILTLSEIDLGDWREFDAKP